MHEQDGMAIVLLKMIGVACFKVCKGSLLCASLFSYKLKYIIVLKWFNMNIFENVTVHHIAFIFVNTDIFESRIIIPCGRIKYTDSQEDQFITVDS
jgi:hypothetical protein